MSRLDRIEDWEKLAMLADYKAAKLAVRCGVSYEGLRRYFGPRFHSTPQALLDELRLSQAAHYLRGSGLSVKEIAAKLHFADASQLCRRFKLRFACAPTDYANRFRALRGGAAGRQELAP